MSKFFQNFKNYFIPHSGNDFKPAALKPKRLLFHAIGAVAVKAVVFAAVASFPLSAWISVDVAGQASKNIIALTNEARLSVGLPVLKENDKLDQAAAQKAGDMLLGQYFAHVSPAGQDLTTWLAKIGYRYSMAGENLAMGFSTAEGVVGAWKKSPTHYANIIDPNFKEIGVAVAGGRLKGDDTALVAQYFGRPAQVSAATVPSSVKTVQLDQSATILSVKGPANGEKVLNIEAKLPAGTVSAVATVSGMKLALAPKDGTATWQGNTIIASDAEKRLTRPVVPATVEIKDGNGESAYADLDWSEVHPVKTSAFEQYSIFKASPSSGMRPVLGIGNIYLIILLAIIGLASLLNILIEIKKQHPRVILSSACTVVVLVVLLLI